MFSSRRVAQFGLVAAVVTLAVSLSLLAARSLPHFSIEIPLAVLEVAELRLSDTAGQPFDVGSLRGKTVVMCFSSNRCEFNDDYISRFSSLARQYQSDPRVEFFAVNEDVAIDSEQALREIRVASSIADNPFETLIDLNTDLAQEYSELPAPQFLLVDPRGQVRYQGAFDDHQDLSQVKRQYLAEQLRSLLKGVSDAAG